MSARAIRWGLPLLLAVAVGVGAAMAATASKHSSAGTVKLAKSSKYGMVLVGSNGMTLYRYTPDKRGGSVCNAGCIGFWPPYLAKGKAKPTAGTGVKAGLLGTIKRSNGALQISYAGFPLYFYSADKKAGAVGGEGFDSKWYVINAKGALVKHAVSASGSPGGTTTKKSVWG